MPGTRDLRARRQHALEPREVRLRRGRARRLEQLSAARSDLSLRRRKGEGARRAAESEKSRIGSITADFEAKQGERERLLGGLNGEIATLVAEAEAARKATEAAEFDPGNVPPASGAGGAAVAYAQAQLGKPYCYAGVGPDCLRQLLPGRSAPGLSPRSITA